MSASSHPTGFDPINGPSGIGRRAASAARWSGLGEIVSRVVTPITYLILARFLDPSDFGIVTAAVLVVALAEVTATTGLSRVLVQREAPRDGVDELSNSVFWFTLLTAGAVFIAVLVVADPVSLLFADPAVVAVIRVQAIQVLVSAAGAVPHARFERALDFRPLFRSRVAATVIPSVVALGGVFAGMGYWALVVGALSGALARTTVLWAGTDWRPSKQIEWRVVREITPLAAWLTAEGLLMWAFGWSDTVIVGIALDTDALGSYRFASIIAVTVFTALLSPLQPVLFSALSRLQENTASQMEAFRVASRVMALVALTLGVALLLLGERVVLAALPTRWESTGEILAFLGMAHGISWIAGAYDSQYRAMGRPDVYAKIMASALPVYLVVYYFAASAGVDQLLWARIVLASLAVMLHVAVAGRLLAYGFKQTAANLWRPVAVAACVAGVILATDVLLKGFSDLSRLAVGVVGGAAAFVISALWLERPLIVRILRLAKGPVSG